MNLLLRIPLTLTIIVVVTGIIALIRISMRGGPIPTLYLIIWIVVSLVLIGITAWAWRRVRRE
jgi:hypothetical protein